MIWLQAVWLPVSSTSWIRHQSIGSPRNRLQSRWLCMEVSSLPPGIALIRSWTWGLPYDTSVYLSENTVTCLVTTNQWLIVHHDLMPNCTRDTMHCHSIMYVRLLCPSLSASPSWMGCTTLLTLWANIGPTNKYGLYLTQSCSSMETLLSYMRTTDWHDHLI